MSLHRQVVVCTSGDSHGSSLGRMMKLAMAATGAHQNPTVLLDDFENLTDLHAGCVSNWSPEINAVRASRGLYRERKQQGSEYHFTMKDVKRMKARTQKL